MVHKSTTKDSLSPYVNNSNIDLNNSNADLSIKPTAVKERKKKLGQSKTKSVSFQLDFLMNEN